MSAELMWGLLVGVVGIAATIAVAVWQTRHDERVKKSLPSQNEITYLALKVLVAAQNQTPPIGLTYDRLYARIVQDDNARTRGGNFDPSSKDATLDAYTRESIQKLRAPEAQALGPLVEAVDDVYRVAPLGLDTFAQLPKNPSEAAELLDGYLGGSQVIRSGSSPSGTGQSAAAPSPRRPTRNQRWRHDVFMAMPEDGPHELDELKKLIGEELARSGARRPADDKKVEQAIAWNLKNENLSQRDDGRIRLAVSKTSKAVEDFK